MGDEESGGDSSGDWSLGIDMRKHVKKTGIYVEARIDKMQNGSQQES